MEQLTPILARELRNLVQDYPGRITSSKLNVFSKFPIAFDMLKAGIANRKVVGFSFDPKQAPAPNNHVFYVIGLASVINCVTSETEPYSWGPVVIPMSLLRESRSTTSGSTKLALPTVQIVSPRLRGRPLHSVESCRVQTELHKYTSNLFVKKTSNELLTLLFKDREPPLLGDRAAWSRKCDNFPATSITVLTDCLINVALKSNNMYYDPMTGDKM